jgi:hypothetical protein
MYRDTQEALRARVDSLHGELVEVARRLEESEAARRSSEARLERLSEGVAEDLSDELVGTLRRLRGVMLVLGVVGATLAGVAAVIVLVRYFDTPLFNLQGVRNAYVHVRDAEGLEGIGVVLAMLLVASPALALPWLAAKNVVALRRQGWMQGLLASTLWAFTPLLPLALFALGKLVSEPVRRAFFAAPIRAASSEGASS